MAFLFKIDTMNKPYQYATYLLSRRDYSLKKLKEKFKLKGFTDEEFQNTMEKLISLKLFDEQRYVQSKIKSLANRGHSINYIQRKLHFDNIKIELEEISDLLQIEGISPEENIRDLLKRKFKYDPDNFDDTKKRKLKDRAIRFLFSKGHGGSQCFSLVQEFFDQSN